MSWQLTTVKTKCSFSFCSSFLYCSTSFYLENTYGGSLKCINNNKARSQCRELHSLLSITSHANQYREDAGDKAYGLSSSSDKTRISNHLQMSWWRQHILFSYLKTLSIGPIRGLNPHPPPRLSSALQHELTKQSSMGLTMLLFSSHACLCHHMLRW